MTSQAISTDGTIIAFDRIGAGAPVVLVHGTTGYRAISPKMTALAERLSQKFTVLHYDRRGRGASGDTAPYAVAREIEDLAALLATTGPAALVGFSSGGVLAAEAAAAGLPITRLVLYEPAIILENPPRPLPPDYVETLDRLLAAGDRDGASQYFLMTVMGIPKPEIEKVRTGGTWHILTGIAHTLPYDGRIITSAFPSFAVPVRWEAITQPTLIVDGSESSAKNHPSADAIAAIIPHASRETLAGQHHDVSIDAIAPAIEHFLA
ncbi:alpha/beta fold hydrolase [Devosia nitrariae]|uniref:Alpha/beta hydrolase n=1 Tax=Devosia nitrariae TaxID=2071872 RepID=A0ABQ5W1Z7_9HYPH|nr:alpha/beta hydrolase [Devosia nitrariae]GLQ53868.1 alpha/beta hydrolase [Devosia nitrariae]